MTFQEKQEALFNQGFDIGTPTSEEFTTTSGGVKQTYTNAWLFQNSFGEVFEVHGAILGKYIECGDAEGELGLPISDEQDDPEVNGGKVSYFENGKITWNVNDWAQVMLNNAIPDAGSGDIAGAPEPKSENNNIENNSQNDTQFVNEVVITSSLLISKLQAIADTAFAMLDLPLEKSKKQIFDTEKPSDPKNWCGNTLAYLYKQNGADPKLVNTYFASTTGLILFGTYNKVAFDGTFGKPSKIYQKITTIKNEESEFQNLEEYHRAKNAERKVIFFNEIQAETPLDILPGDIVLFDHAKAGGPDHIQVVHEWDEANRILVVIDGNGGGFTKKASKANPVTVSSTERGKDGVLIIDKLNYLNNRYENNIIFTNDLISGRIGITCHKLTASNQTNPPDTNRIANHARVWAIIRPSIIDFERHEYKNL